jgi:hypothetical protein
VDSSLSSEAAVQLYGHGHSDRAGRSGDHHANVHGHLSKYQHPGNERDLKYAGVAQSTSTSESKDIKKRRTMKKETLWIKNSKK